MANSDHSVLCCIEGTLPNLLLFVVCVPLSVARIPLRDPPSNASNEVSVDRLTVLDSLYWCSPIVALMGFALSCFFEFEGIAKARIHSKRGTTGRSHKKQINLSAVSMLVVFMSCSFHCYLNVYDLNVFLSMLKVLCLSFWYSCRNVCLHVY